MPLVSIVLPTHNRANLITQSIDSCLQQTFSDFELIVVNDCSTDGTEEILAAYAEKDSRIRIIKNEKNLKLPGSLNRGFSEAKGKYFTWTSDDNLYGPLALEAMVNALETNPEKGLVYADYTEIDDDGNVLGNYILKDINQSFMLWKGCGACFMYKATVHAINNGYDTSLVLIEDYDFFVRSWMNVDFVYLNRSDLYLYRHHEGSLTSLNANAVFELTKIRIEKLQPQLFKKFSDNDKMLFYRKYAVYYSTLKNNIARANYYMDLLWKASKKDYLVSFAYIVVQKIIAAIKVPLGLTGGFFKLLFGKS